jgi:hypothetical protein
MPERFRYKDYDLGPGVPEHASISNEELMMARSRSDYDTGLESALERLESHGAPVAAVKRAKGAVISATLEKNRAKANTAATTIAKVARGRQGRNVAATETAKEAGEAAAERAGGLEAKRFKGAAPGATPAQKRGAIRAGAAATAAAKKVVVEPIVQPATGAEMHPAVAGLLAEKDKKGKTAAAPPSPAPSGPDDSFVTAKSGPDDDDDDVSDSSGASTPRRQTLLNDLKGYKGKAKVPAELKGKIKAAMEELGYVLPSATKYGPAMLRSLTNAIKESKVGGGGKAPRPGSKKGSL